MHPDLASVRSHKESHVFHQQKNRLLALYLPLRHCVAGLLPGCPGGRLRQPHPLVRLPQPHGGQRKSSTRCVREEARLQTAAAAAAAAAFCAQGASAD